jgi:hypothetical protein
MITDQLRRRSLHFSGAKAAASSAALLIGTFMTLTLRDIGSGNFAIVSLTQSLNSIKHSTREQRNEKKEDGKVAVDAHLKMRNSLQ